MIFTNKNISGKTKGIAGSIAAIAMVAAGITGADFNPPSVEKYTEEIAQQNADAASVGINSDAVYWTPAGNKYHAYDDCQYVKGKSLTTGSIQQSFETRGISELCKVCKKRSAKSYVPEGVGELLEVE